jgi:hypothetical protein
MGQLNLVGLMLLGMRLKMSKRNGIILALIGIFLAIMSCGGLKCPEGQKEVCDYDKLFGIPYNCRCE